MVLVDGVLAAAFDFFLRNMFFPSYVVAFTMYFEGAPSVMRGGASRELSALVQCSKASSNDGNSS